MFGRARDRTFKKSKKRTGVTKLRVNYGKSRILFNSKCLEIQHNRLFKISHLFLKSKIGLLLPLSLRVGEADPLLNSNIFYKKEM